MFKSLTAIAKKAFAPIAIATLSFAPAQADIIVDFTAEGTVTEAAGIVVGAPFRLEGSINISEASDLIPTIETVGLYDGLFNQFVIEVGTDDNQATISGSGGAFLVDPASGTLTISGDDVTSTTNIPDIATFDALNISFTGGNLDNDSLIGGLNAFASQDVISDFAIGISPGSASGIINSVIVTSVPEPGSEAALIAAGILLAGQRRRNYWIAENNHS